MHWLHGPTIVIIALFFAPRWVLFGSRFQMVSASLYRLFFLVMIADLVTIIFFLWLAHAGSFFLLLPIPWGLGITAFSLFSLRWCPTISLKKTMDMRTAFIMGCAQGIALLPGISRFGFTYVIARWLGYASRAAFELSFLIEWPLLCIAFIQSTIALQAIIPPEFLHLGLLLAMIAASIGAWYGLFFVNYLVCTNRIWWFSLYLPIPILLWCYVIR
jgi:undecaprenyl pyrophosphate phosphatase UppP